MPSISTPNITYLLLFFLILMTMMSCEEETLEDFNPQGEQENKIVFTVQNGKNLYEKDKNLKEVVQKLKTNSQKSTSSSIYNFGIYESSVQVLEATNYTQYTFEMYRATAITNQLENYVLKIYEDDSNEQFIVTYDLNPDYSYNFNSIEAINDPSLITQKSSGCYIEFVESFESTECSPIWCNAPGHENGSPNCNRDPDSAPVGENCETTTVFVFGASAGCNGGGTDGISIPGDPNLPPIGGSTGTYNNNNNLPDLSDPKTTVTKKFVVVSQCTKDAINNLPQDQADWINSLNNCDPLALTGTTSCNRDLYEDIASFVNSNSNDCEMSAEAKDFLNAVKDALEDDPDAEVDFVDRIIDELEGKEKCLNDHLKDSGNDFVKDMLSNFMGDDSEFGINLKSEYQVFRTDENGNAVEVNAKTTFSEDSNMIKIEISSSKAESRKALQVVRTLLHEYIHADIFRKLNSLPPSNSDLDFRDFYNNFENNNFEPTPAHETMAELYVNSMKEALKSFHMTVMSGDYNYLSSLNPNNLDAFYEALAWQGLKNHGVQSWINIPQNQKDDIDQALQQYIFTTTNNCPN